MVTMQDAIRVARTIVRADKSARKMPDYDRHPDFSEMRDAADAARAFLRSAGEDLP